MSEYITMFMQWVDESGPVVHATFVTSLFLLYLLIFHLIRRITSRLTAKISEEKRFVLRIQNQVIVSAREMSRIIGWLIRTTGLVIAVLIGFSFLNIALGLFETSRGLAANLLELTFNSVGFVVQQLIDYIPSLLVIIIVLLIVRFVLHVLRVVFRFSTIIKQPMLKNWHHPIAVLRVRPSRTYRNGGSAPAPCWRRSRKA